MKDLELLAPARNVDIGIAAIDCGADAVYIAGPAFGARQAAGNDVADLHRLCEYAHRFGARVFVTLNTILYDEELEQAAELLEEVRAAGADAVIVQDMALLRLGAARGAELPLHASTQCAIRTAQKAAELEKLGFSRLILERELSLAQIRSIASAVDCEIECFVHGALCVCYSGQCYMSELIAGRSANRGACIQACRSRYDLMDGNGKTLVRDKALLSLKDFNLKSRLLDLAEAGVTSFKIEGRLKNISYVRNVVREYSLALDTIVEQSGGKYRRASFGRVRRGFTPDVNKTFNRGYTELFIDGRRGKWAAMDAAKSMGEELGTVTNLSRDCSSFTLQPRGDVKLANGDGLSFVGRDGEVAGVRVDVASGLTVRCKRTPELYNGARIYRNFDSAFEKQMDANPCVRLIDATISARFTHGATGTAPSGTLTVTAETEDGRRITKDYTGLWNEFATNPQRMHSMFATQLSKAGDIFQFHFTELTAGQNTDTASGNTGAGQEQLPLLSAASLNSIRNDIAADLASIPCNARPLLAVPAADTNPAPAPRKFSYKDNISNKIAEGILSCSAVESATGAATPVRDIEPAFELTHRRNAELMRTKYCIRHELGLCPHLRTTSAQATAPRNTAAPAEPLYLLNNGHRFTVIFDCPHCEMVIKA